MAQYVFLGTKVEDKHLATLDSLSALLETQGRSATLRALLDSPIAALILATQSNGMAANKKTAQQRQTAGAGLATITEGAYSSDNSILPQP